MSLVADKKGDFSLFRLLFGVVSDLFQPVLACYGCLPLHCLQETTSQNILTYKVALNQLHYLRTWLALLRSVEFQCTTKRGKSYYKEG